MMAPPQKPGRVLKDLFTGKILKRIAPKDDGTYHWVGEMLRKKTKDREAFIEKARHRDQNPKGGKSSLQPIVDKYIKK